MVFREGSWTEHLSQFFLSESDGKGKEEKSSLSNHSSFTQTNGWVNEAERRTFTTIDWH